MAETIKLQLLWCEYDAILVTDRALWERLKGSYSATDLRRDEIQQPVEFEGKRYVSRGGIKFWSNQGDFCEIIHMYEVAPREEYKGEVYGHRDEQQTFPEGTYHRRLARYNNEMYVLLGPEAVFAMQIEAAKAVKDG